MLKETFRCELAALLAWLVRVRPEAVCDPTDWERMLKSSDWATRINPLGEKRPGLSEGTQEGSRWDVFRTVYLLKGKFSSDDNIARC